jgi:hypothetical protein
MNPTTLSLSQPLQALAERYLAARRRSGEALLEAAQALAEARAQARHGEWYGFLKATHTSAATAERLLNIHRLAGENLQFAGFVRDNWIGVSVAGLLARPSTPPIVIERVTTRQIAATIEAVQSAIDDVDAQAAAPPYDPSERQAAVMAEYEATNNEIREAMSKMLRAIATTAPALALLQQRLSPDQYAAALDEAELDHAVAEMLLKYATNPPQSLDDLPASFTEKVMPWAVRTYQRPVPPDSE